MSTTTTIHLLPDDCLRELFSRFALQEVLQLRPVCTKWNCLIKERCRQTHSLKLFRSFREVTSFCASLPSGSTSAFTLRPIGSKDDDLVLSSTKAIQDPVAFLAELFPNIQTFATKGYFFGSLDSKNILELLHIWQHRLVNLYVDVDFLQSLDSLEGFWNLLEHSPKLRQLHLGRDSRIFTSGSRLPVGRLQSLTLADCPVEFLASLSSSSLKELRIGTLSGTVEEFQNALERDQKPGNLNLEYLLIKKTSSSSNLVLLLELICGTFKALQHLELLQITKKISLPEILGSLVSLPSLTQLSLPYSCFWNLSKSSLPRLPAISVLHLLRCPPEAIPSPEVDQFNSFLLSIFTNLKKLVIYESFSALKNRSTGNTSSDSSTSGGSLQLVVVHCERDRILDKWKMLGRHLERYQKQMEEMELL